MLIRPFPIVGVLGCRLVLAMAMFFLAAPSHADYTFSLLDMLPDYHYGDSTAGRVTNSDRVLGVQSIYDGPFSVATWRGKQIADVAAAAGLPGTYRYFHPSTMNESGKVVGHSTQPCNSPNSAAHATLWQNDLITALGILGGKNSYAMPSDIPLRPDIRS
jgi:hypothetical protein